MSEPVFIGKWLRVLCNEFGLEYDNVARVNIEPGLLRADVYLLNDHGSKYIDLEKNEAAMESLEFKVKT